MSESMSLVSLSMMSAPSFAAVPPRANKQPKTTGAGAGAGAGAAAAVRDWSVVMAEVPPIPSPPSARKSARTAAMSSSLPVGAAGGAAAVAQMVKTEPRQSPISRGAAHSHMASASASASASAAAAAAAAAAPLPNASSRTESTLGKRKAGRRDEAE
jgi:hypothetical protein